MSVMSELAYDIEQLYIEGYGPKSIAIQLECPLEIVYGWIEGQGVSASDEELSPFSTMNS
jgi:hypothetical protein